MAPKPCRHFIFTDEHIVSLAEWLESNRYDYATTDGSYIAVGLKELLKSIYDYLEVPNNERKKANTNKPKRRERSKNS